MMAAIVSAVLLVDMLSCLCTRSEYANSGWTSTKAVRHLQHDMKKAIQNAECMGPPLIVVHRLCAFQGEGGCTPGQQAFLQGLRELCDEAGALLVFDEVQCGLGRTGKLWSYQHYGVEPDIMSLAKPLAGGLPIGAVLLTQKVADVMKPGQGGASSVGAMDGLSEQ